MQSDPIGLDGGVDTFGYAGQRPIVSVDPHGLFEILWKPREFPDYKNRPTWVRALEQYRDRLQEKINRLCEGDRQDIQAYFNNWKVGYRSAEGNPTTHYGTKTTTLTNTFFRLPRTLIEPENQYWVLLHEFRHVMDKNEALYPGIDIYSKARVLGKASQLEYEKDADRFATKLSGSCTCGIQ